MTGILNFLHTYFCSLFLNLIYCFLLGKACRKGQEIQLNVINPVQLEVSIQCSIQTTNVNPLLMTLNILGTKPNIAFKHD